MSFCQNEVSSCLIFTKESKMDDLKNRVTKFHCLQLPGQPRSMHMGTAYLIEDLWKEVQKLREKIDKLCASPKED